MSKVIIKAHPTTNELFTETANPEWKKCMLQSTRITVNNGVISSSKVVAFALIAAVTAEALIESGISSNDEFPVPGKIVVNEYYDTDEDYREGMVAKQYAGSHAKAGENVLVNGKEVYRETEFTTDFKAQDSLKREITVAVIEESNDLASDLL